MISGAKKTLRIRRKSFAFTVIKCVCTVLQQAAAREKETGSATGSATTIEAIRRVIQNSQASLRQLSPRYVISQKTGRTSASTFLTALIKAVHYKIHNVLTNNGLQFTFPPAYASGPTARYMTRMPDVLCQENGIDHRLARIKHPWTKRHVERMNHSLIASDTIQPASRRD